MNGKRGSYLLGIFIFSALVLGGLPFWTLAEGASSERAVVVLSQALGISTEGLTVAGMAPLADTGVRRYKLIDAQGNLHGVNLDAAGSAVSNVKVERLLKEIDNRGFVGKLEINLADKLAKKDDTPIKVLFWLKGETAPPRRGEGVKLAEYEAHLQTVRSQVAAIAWPFVDKLKKTKVVRVRYQAQDAPLVAATVKPSELRALADQPEVERIYLERERKPFLGKSRVVVQADIMESTWKLSGQGIRLGIVEPGRIGQHPNLPPNQRVLVQDWKSSEINDHKTNAAGVIQSTDSYLRGMAPSCTLLDAIAKDYGDAEIMAAMDAVFACTPPPKAVNMSFGSYSQGSFDAMARYVDRKIYYLGGTLAIAAGNGCNYPDYYVASPALAFNCLAVGAFNDHSTVAWQDDKGPCTTGGTDSSYVNPKSPWGDREKPELVAPGEPIWTTNMYQGFSEVYGTSVAAPHVTAGAGLLNQRKPDLLWKTEQTRAIIMASSRHNIEGDSRLSDRDGAGAQMMAAADRVLRDGTSGHFTSPGGPAGFPFNFKFFAEAGCMVRVAIAWAHKSPLGDTWTRPTTDLDLILYDIDSKSFAYSVSFDNNYEIVEFKAPVTGYYKGMIINIRNSPGWEYVGWAASMYDS
jgi:hypothetical protein